MSATPSLNANVHDGCFELLASGSWTAVHAGELEAAIGRAAGEVARAGDVSIDMRDVAAFDTYGAWLLERLIRKRSGDGRQTGIVGLREDFQGLLQDVHAINRKEAPEAKRHGLIRAVFCPFSICSERLASPPRASSAARGTSASPRWCINSTA